MVHSFQQVERKADGRGFRIGEIGPHGFLVRSDCGLRLGERQAIANVAVHVAVRDVVNKLTNGPAAGPVRSVELLVSPALDGLSKLIRKLGDGLDGCVAVGLGKGFGTLEPTDRVAEVCHGVMISRAP